VGGGPILEWLAEARRRGASDLHLVPGAPPHLRVRGDLEPLDGLPELPPEDMGALVEPLLDGAQASWSDFLMVRHEMDLGVDLPEVGRLRVNLLFDRGRPAAAIRLVPREIPPLAALGLPRVTESLMRRAKGLWIFTGATGSGKTTTQAAIVRAILDERPVRVITLEDPIEYVHRHGRGLVSQREIGRDTESFEQGIVSALREDPDVILVGEMRDLETMRQALRAAETGHLVLTTLHTTDATQVPDRIIDAFPAGQQNQIRIQLSEVLLAVFAQQLVRCDGGRAGEGDGALADLRGRVAAFEVLLGPMAELYQVRTLIRQPQPGGLYAVMEQNVAAGCQTMERALVDLVLAGRLSPKAARQAAVRRDVFDRLLEVRGGDAL
jgi:twitching motility protein PilT